jgi:hypothetical protein
MRNDFPAGRCRFGHAKHESGCAVFFRNSPDDRPASVADIVVEELRKKESDGPIRLPKRDFFTRGQKLKVKDPGTFSPATIWNSPACRHVSVCA